MEFLSTTIFYDATSHRRRRPRAFREDDE